MTILAGCASSGGPKALTAQEWGDNPRIVEGDFDDVDAVVAGILPRHKLVAFERSSDSQTKRVFELRGLDDSRGSLIFEKLQSAQIRVSCSISRFGDPQREQRMLRSLAHRFRQLRGDVAVPISDP